MLLTFSFCSKNLPFGETHFVSASLILHAPSTKLSITGISPDRFLCLYKQIINQTTASQYAFINDALQLDLITSFLPSLSTLGNSLRILIKSFPAYLRKVFFSAAFPLHNSFHSNTLISSISCHTKCLLT